MITRALWLLSLWITSSQSQELFCPLSLLIPFHDGRLLDNNLVDDSGPYAASVVSEENHRRDGLTLLTTALIAIEDFNNRTSSVVPDVSNFPDCQIVFPVPLLADSGRDGDQVKQTQNSWLRPATCAVIGPMDNIAAQAVGNALVGSIIPALSYGARASVLTNSTFYPNLALGTVQWKDVVLKLMQYLLAQRLYDVAILYTPGDQLDYYDYLLVWEEARDATGLNVLLSLISSRSYEPLKTRLSAIQDKKLDTIVVALQRDDNLEVLAQVAEELGMLSDDYTWILMDEFISPQYIGNIEASPTSPIGKLLLRSRAFQLLDGLVPHNNTTDVSQTFQNEWTSRGPNLVDQINSLLNRTTGLENVTIDPTFFRNNAPAYGASYLYDAILATGMSACAGQWILGVEHSGASGVYRFNDRSLDPNAVEFGVFSIERVDEMYQPILVHTTKNGTWNVLAGEEGEGSIGVDIHLSVAATSIGLFLASFATIFCLMNCYFVYHFKKNRIVSVGQPEFLYMVCGGAALPALSIFFMSFDEGDGWSQKMLDISCIVITWLEYLGAIIIYMALFSKLWRVEKVTQIRRGQLIQVHHVLAPFGGMMVGTFGLLVAWTIADPPSWKRTVIESGKNVGDTIGHCEQSMWFAIPLDLLVIVAVMTVLFISLKTRHLPDDISDSRRVFQTLASHLVVLMIGFVFLLISVLLSNYNFAYMTQVLVAFGYSIMSLAFLITPKMYDVYRHKKTGELPSGLQRGRTRISGITATPGPGIQPQSSRFTLHEAYNPSSSMQSSGISNISSNSQTDISGSRSTILGKFSSYVSNRSLGSSTNRSTRSILRSGNASANKSTRSLMSNGNKSTRSILTGTIENSTSPPAQG